MLEYLKKSWKASVKLEKPSQKVTAWFIVLSVPTIFIVVILGWFFLPFLETPDLMIIYGTIYWVIGYLVIRRLKKKEIGKLMWRDEEK